MDRVKADSNRAAVILTTLRIRERVEDSKGKTESLSKQVKEEQKEEESASPCAFLFPSQITKGRESESLFARIRDTGTNCF
jgi:hypothetical protein